MKAETMKQLKNIADMYDKDTTSGCMRNAYVVTVINIMYELCDYLRVNKTASDGMHEKLIELVELAIKSFVQNEISIRSVCKLVEAVYNII